MKLSFSKMTGAGNDFIVIDNRSRKVRKGSKAARILCDRRWGIGADGLLLLEKSRRASYRMMYYNADGSYGGMCGNGGRCIALYAVKLGIAPKKHSFVALDHIYKAEVRGAEVILAMKDPGNLRLEKPITLKSGRLSASFVDTGSPHVVIPIVDLPGHSGSLEALDVVTLGREIRYHRAYAPQGTNVNFIERKGRNSVRIRTYERGVEDETLACGTGSIASAIVASRLWNLRSPVTVIPKSRKSLKVVFESAGEHFRNIRLAGPAQVIFSGFIDV